jgi:replicative DNA helicase
MAELRLSPQSIEAEMSILGSIFLENACLRKVASMVDGLDFFRETHRKIYQAMLSLDLKREPIDLVTMVQRLKNDGQLEEVGGGAYLATLVDYVPTAANVAYYCRIVKEKSAARKIITFANELAGRAYEDTGLSEIITDAREGLAEITGSLDGLNGVSASDILNFERREERYSKYVKEVDKLRFKTSFDLLDRSIRGVAPGEVLTVIAYSGTFKTAFLQNLLLRGAEASGFYHLFFSLEMPVEKVFEREMQIQGGVAGRDVESHFSKERESCSVQAGTYRMGSQGLLVCDRPRLSLDKISRYIELARQKFGKIGAVGIDYMGLMQAPGKTLFEKMAYISIEAKNMAKELSIPVLMLCQINRAAATAGGEIEMHSAKGGGDIEAGADFMLGFWRDRQDQLVCKVLKNRNGRTGDNYRVEIDRSTLQFKDMIPYKPESKAGSKDKGGIPF